MTDPEKAKRSILSETLSFIETLFITFFIVMLVFTYIVGIVTVNGESMKETLMPDERILVSPLYFTPKAGDIVVVNASEAVTLNDDGSVRVTDGLGKNIIKRIIATGGQSVNIDFQRGAVYVDDVMLNEDYVTLGLTHNDEGAFTGRYPITVPEGYVFVMGDNRPVSKDSRSADVGFLSENNIEGKALIRIAPLDRSGSVY